MDASKWTFEEINAGKHISLVKIVGVPIGRIRRWGTEHRYHTGLDGDDDDHSFACWLGPCASPEEAADRLFEDSGLADIHAANLDAVKTKVGKLVKRLGAGSIELHVLGHYARLLPDGQREPRTIVGLLIEQPRTQGWRIVARLEDTAAAAGGTIFRAVPGEWMPQRYRDTDVTRCEHCQARRHRKNTFVVGHDDGTFLQIGSSCLKEVFGCSPQQLLSFAKKLREASNHLRGMASEPPQEQVWDVRDFLDVVHMSMRQRGGFRSRSGAEDEGGMATADHTLQLLDYDEELRQRMRDGGHGATIDPNEDDRAATREVLDWLADGWQQIPDEKRSEYVHNCVVAVSSGIVSRKTAGLVASVPQAMKRDKLRQMQDAAGDSQHVGDLGERIQLGRVTLILRRYVETSYGGSNLLKFLDGQGNILVWFTSSDGYGYDDRDGNGVRHHHSWTEGAVYEGKATVKRHGSYKGVAETTLTRAALRLEGTW